MTLALVTGATRGIGAAVAATLAARGMTVIVGARDAEAGYRTAQLIGHGASHVRLDVTDEASVRAAAAAIACERGTLDVLVNNAGVLPEAANSRPAEIVDLEMFRQTFGTNLLGAVAVLEAFLPLLRRSSQGRIVNVSTTMGSLTDQTDPDSPYYATVVPAYQSSKAALNNVTIVLAKQLVDTAIKVTSVCPGFVQTDLTPVNREQGTITAEQAAKVIVEAATLPPDAPSGTFIGPQGTLAW